MRGAYVYPEDFIELIRNLPGSASAIQDRLANTFGILSTKSSPEALWEAIVEQRGEEGAEDVVSALVLSLGGKRLERLIRASADDQEVHIQADDSSLIRQLFEPDGLPTDLGAELIDYWERSGGGDSVDLDDDEDMPLLGEDDGETDGSTTENRLGEGLLPDLGDLLLERPRPSAPVGTGWKLERVEPFLGKILKIEARWKERDLEEFLWVNWGQIDFGSCGLIRLVGRQVQLSPRRQDRVDFLGRGENGEWVAIELKIGQATSSDFTQLLSYLSDLASRGVAARRIRGVLIAPSFRRKLLNAAAVDPRVTLLRFEIAEGG